MKLDRLKTAYFNNQIQKADYIVSMFGLHKSLFNYSKFIGNTDIAKIEILPDCVVMTTKINNIKMICDDHDRRLVPIEILNFNSYEKDEMNMMSLLISDGFNIFDIGANFGWYSIYFSKNFKKAKIFAFEPIGKSYEYLKKNLRLNKCKNVHAYKLGFSDKEEKRIFFLRSYESASASWRNLQPERKSQKVECKLTRLDDFVKSHNLKIDFMKCDVEGSELFVFKGAIEAIRQNKPIIFAEMLRKWSAKFKYHPNEIIKLLGGLGYYCFTIGGKRLKKFLSMDEKTIETNFFFLHTKKHSRLINNFSE